VNPRELEEYKALRATIRERGTARVWIFAAGVAIWGAMVLAVASLAALPVATLLPLVLLAACFEAIFALHTGVERIGRYLQVFYEDETSSGDVVRNWEHAAMRFGQAVPGRGADPLFSGLFLIAAVVNFFPAALAVLLPSEYIVIGSAHLAFIVRVLLGRRHAKQQRATDLAAFEKLSRGQ
jgi:hypothetical protein